jgi:hypothetical protein
LANVWNDRDPMPDNSALPSAIAIRVWLASRFTPRMRQAPVPCARARVTASQREEMLYHEPWADRPADGRAPDTHRHVGAEHAGPGRIVQPIGVDDARDHRRGESDPQKRRPRESTPNPQRTTDPAASGPDPWHRSPHRACTVKKSRE